MDSLVFVAAAICVCIGFALNQFFEHRKKRARQADGDNPDSASQTPEPGIDTELARDLFQALNGLTATVDTNVDRHSSRVAQISDELSLTKSNDAKAVLAATTQLIEANRQLQTELSSAKDEIQVQQRQIHEYMTEARTDGLTELANRRAFDQELSRRLAQWHRQATPLSLILVDVDHFKRFNDYHGHQTGDEILRRVAEVLTGTVREMDFVARYGGEEFAVILPGTTCEEAIVSAERLRVAIAEDSLVSDGIEYRVTVSLGLAQALSEEDKADLVKRADSALYAAKEAGRNCGYSHNGEICQLIQPISHAAELAGLRV